MSNKDERMTEFESNQAPMFECAAGTIVGFVGGDVVRATGITYAQAERFRPPVPEAPAAQPIVATSPAPACPQPQAELGPWPPDPMGALTYDEHCQRLSVTLPRGAAAGDALPVMVWIHGGGYTSGAGDAPVYDPSALVREQRVVVVAVTYRLGLFGYLGSADGRPANLGLLDQIEALRWVQRNIAAFGGDPAAVTVFGQSSGGDAVAHLMVAQGARGLFRRAIIQSPPLGIARGRAEMSQAMNDAAAELGTSTSAEQIVAAQTGVAEKAAPFGLLGALPFGTQYGLPPLPAEDDLDAAWAEVAREVDVLIGHTDREAALFVPENAALSKLGRIPVLGRPALGAAVAILTRRIYSAAIEAFAKRHSRAGGLAYRYVITWGAPGNPYAGAHTIDVPLLLGDRDAWQDAPLIDGADWPDVERQGRLLRQIWAGFARTGRVEPVVYRGLIRLAAASGGRGAAALDYLRARIASRGRWSNDAPTAT